MKKLFCVLLVIINFFFCLLPVLADETDVCSQSDKQVECQKQIDDLNAKITAASNSINTLSGQITYYDNQIALNQLKITQTVDLISIISTKIDTLEGQLQKSINLLQQQIVVTYKQSLMDPVQMIFTSSDFSQLISRLKYSQLLQESNRKLLHDTQYLQSNYAQQKDLIQASKKKLQAQKDSLASLRAAKDSLLQQTKNNEATYQKLLAQAQAEHDAFARFTAGGGLLPPQPSPDGWYMNQRDQRWGMACIGTTCNFLPPKTPSFVWRYGCLITSVAMLQKKNGVDINPGQMASHFEYFVEDLLNIPWPAQSGFKFTNYGKNMSLVDSELAAGRPVIIELVFSNGSQHFIVLKSKNGSDYIMNDPWFGPDLNFSDHYSFSNIRSVSTYTHT
jgi:peptidoglycan hydrolase CwlO-like protein